MGTRGNIIAGIVAAGISPTLAQAEETTIADGLLDKDEISEFSIVETPEGAPLQFEGRTVFQVETEDGITVYGTSDSSYADGPSVRGISTIITNADGEPVTTYEDAYEVVTGEELPEVEAAEADAPEAEVVEVVEPEAGATIDLGPLAGEAEAGEAGGILDDGEITRDEVETSSPVIITRDEALQLQELSEAGAFADEIDSIAIAEADGGEYRVTINGGNTLNVTGTDGEAYCGNASSAFDASVRGLDLGTITTETTIGQSCEELIGLTR